LKTFDPVAVADIAEDLEPPLRGVGCEESPLE